MTCSKFVSRKRWTVQNLSVNPTYMSKTPKLDGSKLTKLWGFFIQKCPKYSQKLSASNACMLLTFSLSGFGPGSKLKMVPRPKIEKNKCVLNWLLGKIQNIPLILFSINVENPQMISFRNNWLAIYSLLLQWNFSKNKFIINLFDKCCYTVCTIEGGPLLGYYGDICYSYIEIMYTVW